MSSKNTLYISRIHLINWKNFQRTDDLALGDRVFIIGPNASGKSNFLDAFRFLRDLVKENGGLQAAVNGNARGGLKKIRCLNARQGSDIEVSVDLKSFSDDSVKWTYELSFNSLDKSRETVAITGERVVRGDQVILERPDADDGDDPVRLTQTHLQQINANKDFREIAECFKGISYLHLVPQLLKFPEAFLGSDLEDDPFGQKFLERLFEENKRTSSCRLGKIEKLLKSAVPKLTSLKPIKDKKGRPHIEARYDHWRANSARQTEEQFSDGTLRMIALLWSILDGNSLLLIEEPELSLHTAIVRELVPLFHRLMKASKISRQIIISTHSPDLLSDKGIGGEEVLLLQADKEGSVIVPAVSKPEIRYLLESGLSVSTAAMNYTRPENLDQLRLFEK